MNHKTLSKYPRASIREIGSIAFPMMLSLLSSYVLLLSDRLFLAHYSLTAFEGCAAAIGLYFLFQMLTNRFISTIQAFVGQKYGAKKEAEAVSYVWQMIWLALLSPLIIFPIGFLLGKSFFKGSPIETEAMTYLTYMLGGNVLLALEVALSSFYAGIGDSKRVLKAHLLSHPLNILLNYALIFGVSSYIPPLGIHGAAIGTLCAKGLTCFFLFKHFYVHFSPHRFQSPVRRFIRTRLFECIQKALPRAVGQGAVILAWNFGARLLIQAGGIDLLALTFGTTLFVPLINDALGVAILSISSYLIGKEAWSLFPKLFRSISFFILVNAAIMAVPFLFYSSKLIQLFVDAPLTPSDYAILTKTSFMIWLNFVTNSIYVVSFMLLTAIKDMKFYLFIHVIVGGILYYFSIYYFYEKPYWSPELLWFINAIIPILIGSIYYLRVWQKLKNLKIRSLLKTRSDWATN